MRAEHRQRAWACEIGLRRCVPSSHDPDEPSPTADIDYEPRRPRIGATLVEPVRLVPADAVDAAGRGRAADVSAVARHRRQDFGAAVWARRRSEFVVHRLATVALAGCTRRVSTGRQRPAPREPARYHRSRTYRRTRLRWSGSRRACGSAFPAAHRAVRPLATGSIASSLPALGSGLIAIVSWHDCLRAVGRRSIAQSRDAARSRPVPSFLPGA
jgi:hypothetical protein